MVSTSADPANENLWVDPRSNPKPKRATLQPRIAEDEADIAELMRLCKTGRIYQVEPWIRSGKPLQVRHEEDCSWHRPKTPLKIAIETGQYDLALLLLCNGYSTELEPPGTLNFALEQRAWDFVDLMLAWGTDPGQADPYFILDTYQRPIMDRFWELGVDFSRDNTLASYLSEATRNKPAYGWARRHRSEPKIAYQLALGLEEAVSEDREKAVCLLLWAGADPHRRVPSLRWGSGIEDDPDDDRQSAIECAVHSGHGHLLRHLKPDPKLDDIDELYSWASDPTALRHLAAIQPPSDWSTAIVRNIHSWGYAWRETKARECLRHIFEDQSGCLRTLDGDGRRDLRRSMLRLNDYDLKWLLLMLGKADHCERSIFLELIRTPTMRKRMVRMGLEKDGGRR
jgi:hypothetical protein